MAVVLFRRLLGDVLRSRRVAQGRTLRQLCGEARVSLGYMSEIERGQKEASSELLAAICTALDVPLSEILSEVADAVALEEAAMAVRLEQVAARPLTSAGQPLTAAPQPLRDSTDQALEVGEADPTGDVVASAA